MIMTISIMMEYQPGSLALPAAAGPGAASGLSGRTDSVPRRAAPALTESAA
jgi:hypothetical protein